LRLCSTRGKCNSLVICGVAEQNLSAEIFSQVPALLTEPKLSEAISVFESIAPNIQFTQYQDNEVANWQWLCIYGLVGSGNLPPMDS